MKFERCSVTNFCLMENIVWPELFIVQSRSMMRKYENDDTVGEDHCDTEEDV